MDIKNAKIFGDIPGVKILGETDTSWKEELQKKHFPKYLDGDWSYIDISGDEVGEMYEDMVQFISDLRKKDEQALLLKLSLETQYCGKEVEMKISKIIEQHYAD